MQHGTVTAALVETCAGKQKSKRCRKKAFYTSVSAIICMSFPQNVLPDISQSEVCITQIMNAPDDSARPGKTANGVQNRAAGEGGEGGGQHVVTRGKNKK